MLLCIKFSHFHPIIHPSVCSLVEWLRNVMLDLLVLCCYRSGGATMSL